MKINMDATTPEMPVSTPTQAVVAKSEKLLADAVRSNVMSEPGSKFVLITTNPYHDNPIAGCRGGPTGGSPNSVVCQVTQERTFKKPVFLGSGNWGMRVNNTQHETPIEMTRGLVKGDVVLQTDSNIVSYVSNGFDVSYNLDGEDFILTGDGLSIPVEYTKGNFRVIAKALEIINTTAVINRQGLCTACRYSQPDIDHYNSYVALFGDEPYKNSVTGLNLFLERLPPSNLAEAVLYPQNAQWEAEKGYYAPVYCKVDSVVTMPQPVYPLQINQDFVAGPEVIQTQLSYSPKVYPELFSGNTATFFSPANVPSYSPQDGICAFFTGLSDQSTLTVRCRWVIERFPGKDEKEILVLAQPSCPRDDFALELQSRFFRFCPAAVDYGQNPNGEWGKKAVSFLAALAKQAGPLIGMLPFPGAGAFGKMVSMGGGALAGNGAMQPQQKPKRIQPTQVVTVTQKPPVRKQKKKKSTQTKPR